MKTIADIESRIDLIKKQISKNEEFLNTTPHTTKDELEVMEDTLELNSRIKILEWVLN